MPVQEEKTSYSPGPLEKKFFEEYDKLNEQQRLAVDTLEGPVMVIAGPGTGKTQILACRIGKILLEGLAHAENILCLTYTDAGVVAMRKRLQQFIGPEAYKVNIYTFHAFCHDVIQENLSLFEKTAMDPVSELEKIQFYKELIDTLPENHLLKRYRGDVYFEINNLQSLFRTMKREGWTPAFVDERIQTYINDLPNRDEFRYQRKYKGFNAGDLKKDKIEEEKERMEKLRAAAGEFERFQELMRKKNRYDFDDMINWVITAFHENKNLLADYQERFQYILVDEYQDTNGAQNKLVELLISYWDKPNIFVVGDDDQSIYRFQGANLENMLEFADSFKKDLLTVVLNGNYRSTQPIIDVSGALISRNEKRLVNKMKGLSKELYPGKEGLHQRKHPPVIREYETQREEMIGIIKQVQHLLAEGVPPGKIGIIYKENKYGEELAQYFRIVNLPVFSRRDLNILEIPLAQKIILLLKYLAAEHEIPYSGDEMLFELLHADWFSIPPVEVAKLSIQASDRNYKGEHVSIRQIMAERSSAPASDLFASDAHEKINNASRVIEGLIGHVPNLSLQQLFERVIRESGILQHVLQSPDKHWQLQVISGLFDFIKAETHRNPYLDLQHLVTLIELMEDEQITLPLVQVSGSEKGINLMTAHGSKGLEFEYVFLAGCNAHLWEKKRKPGGGYKLPDTLFPLAAGENSDRNEDEELRRLFYVAITRAEQHLYLSYSRFKNDGRETEPSLFIAEILERQDLPVEKMITSAEMLAEFTTLEFTGTGAPEIERMEEEFISRLLDKFVMNVTALNNYLRCPLEFYFKNLIRIPSGRSEATEFGSAVHYALEKLFRSMQESGAEKFPSKETFIREFEWYMQRHRESFTAEQFARRMEYGQNVLDNYYEYNIHGFNKIVAIERRFNNVVVRNVPLKGKLDKLEFDGKSVNVVDYKTGDPDKGILKIKGPTEKDPNGGDYWRQGVFYKILVDHYKQKDWKVVSTEFDFIEPDKKKRYRKEKLVITPADITTVTQQIILTWQKIQNREFYTGCGKEDCHWCRFVKTNNLAVTLHDEEPVDEPEL